MGLKESYARSAAQTRKAKSEKQLIKLNVKINPQLPCIDDESSARIKSPEKLIKRAVTALFAAQIGKDCSNPEADVCEAAEFYYEILERFGCADEITPDEKKFFDLKDPEAPKPSKTEAEKMASRIEMAMPLFWAGGLTKELSYPDKETSFIEEARLVVACDSLDELMRGVRAKKPQDILDMADLVYRMNWACADARANREMPSGRLNSEVVAERNKGLSWLIGSSKDWDKTE